MWLTTAVASTLGSAIDITCITTFCLVHVRALHAEVFCNAVCNKCCDDFVSRFDVGVLQVSRLIVLANQRVSPASRCAPCFEFVKQVDCLLINNLLARTAWHPRVTCKMKSQGNAPTVATLSSNIL